jgi:dynein heavy chain 1
VTGRIFAIESQRSRTGRGNVLKLKVNFLPEIITLSKEVSILNLHMLVNLHVFSVALMGNVFQKGR